MQNEPQHVVVTPQGGSRIPAHVAFGSALRRRPTQTEHGSHLLSDQHPKRGMWVVYSGRTGILTNLEPGDIATVILVDHQGLNNFEVHVAAKELRQAYFQEIPEPRRPEYKDAVRFGYVTKS